MTLELMRELTDCEVVAIANACGVTYEQAKTALNWRRLPKGAENPAYGKTGNHHLLAWGDSQQLRPVPDYQLISYFRKGWPNCAFTVYKASVWRLVIARIQGWFN